MAVWDDILPDEDRRRCIDQAGQGGRLEYGKRPAVLIVDMTKGFVYDRFFLGNEAQSIPCVRSISRLLDVARCLRVPVYYSKGMPYSNPAVQGHYKITAAVAEAMGTEEAHEIVPELAPRDGDLVVVKNRPSAFFGTPLISYLLYNRIDTLIVSGMTTAGCVRATVVDAFSYDFIVIVPEECVADRAELSHKVSLFDMHVRYADVIPLHDVIQYLDGLGSPLPSIQQSETA